MSIKGKPAFLEVAAVGKAGSVIDSQMIAPTAPVSKARLDEIPNSRRYNNRNFSRYQPRKSTHPQGYIKRLWAEVWDQEMGCFYLAPIDGNFRLVPASLSDNSSLAQTK